MPKWRNWQTRVVQVHVLARVWRFESSFRHHKDCSVSEMAAEVCGLRCVCGEGLGSVPGAYRSGTKARFLRLRVELSVPKCPLFHERTALIGEVEDDADADGLEQVRPGLIGDAGDAADAELHDADVHKGEDFEVKAGEALVGKAVVDDDAAVLEGESVIEAGSRGISAVGAGEAEGALDVGGKEFVLGGEGGAQATEGGVEAAAGAGGGGACAVGWKRRWSRGGRCRGGRGRCCGSRSRRRQRRRWGRRSRRCG